jgi:hypothetical protein
MAAAARGRKKEHRVPVKDVQAWNQELQSSALIGARARARARPRLRLLARARRVACAC